LDLILKTEIKQVVDWNLVDKEAYLSAMQRSVIKDVEIKALLKQAIAIGTSQGQNENPP
jgi:cell filamentation protein